MPKLSKFKVVLVGDQNVGKTSIISRFIQDSFEPTTNPTVGIDFVTKTMQIDGETLRLQLWDTAGQERFRSLIPSYVRDADCCLIVIDVSFQSSFEGIDKWIDFVRQSRGHDGLLYLIGNKSDVEDRQVSKKDLEEYAEKHNYPYLQVSAKIGSNIHNLFRKVSQKLIEQKKINNKDYDLNSKTDAMLHNNNQQKDNNNIMLTNEQSVNNQAKNNKNCNC